MAKDLPFEAAPPASVADAIAEALAGDHLEVFPDPIARNLRDGLAADRHAVERSFWPAV